MCMYLYVCMSQSLAIHPLHYYHSPFCLLQQDHIDACHEQAVLATGNLKLSDSWKTRDVSNEVFAFCERFSLGPEEFPQEGWRIIHHDFPSVYVHLYTCIHTVKYVRNTH